MQHDSRQQVDIDVGGVTVCFGRELIPRPNILSILIDFSTPFLQMGDEKPILLFAFSVSYDLWDTT
jgi:hypothetical protein